MATLYFTNNSDTGDGTLRQAITDASNGDTIKPQGFDAGDITILLSSNLPVKSFTLDAGENNRIVLDGQNAADFFRIGGASMNITFNKVTFKNGTRSNSAPVYCSAFTALTFNQCAFIGNSGTYAGFIYLTANTTGTLTFENCYAHTNTVLTSTRGGVLFVAGSSTATVYVKGCTFGGTANGYGDIVDGGQTTVTNSLIANNNGTLTNFSTAGMVNASASSADYRLTSSSAFLTGGATSGVDFYGHVRTGSVGAFDGSFAVSPRVMGNTTVDWLDGVIVRLENGAFLSVRRGVISTGECTGVGYLATPQGTSLAWTHDTSVKLCYYGADISNFAAARSGGTVNVVWNQSNNIPAILESSEDNGTTWSTVANSNTGSATIATVKATRYRLFNGIEFLTASVAAVVVSSELAEKIVIGYIVTRNSIGYLN